MNSFYRNSIFLPQVINFHFSFKFGFPLISPIIFHRNDTVIGDTVIDLTVIFYNNVSSVATRSVILGQESSVSSINRVPILRAISFYFLPRWRTTRAPYLQNFIRTYRDLCAENERHPISMHSAPARFLHE